MPTPDTTTEAPEFDENLIDAADKLLQAALRGHAFRLAVQCHVCGTWLVAPESVRRHLGPRCAAKLGRSA
ncbi:DUF6011 domain-containing protein [Rhodococcus sp. T2V]|uniref:DUF6011 domain-containing protein n=1 Tax=Rhodococcus sp. T2V TaxID=3034164 RepID=UPI0034E2B553